MKKLAIDQHYVLDVLLNLLRIPSPSGYTDRIVQFMIDHLEQLGVDFELTRRGAIRATLKGQHSSPDRAIIAHLDTLGAMVKSLKSNGRVEVVPVGHWNARFAEGARVKLFADLGVYTGTLLPLKASGHTFAHENDKQPSSWDNLEMRIDERCYNLSDLLRLGVHIGDFIAVQPQPEILKNGYIVSRHLDDKAGVAVLLGAMKAVIDSGVELPVDCHPLFTISEEVGSGASAVLHGDVAEMLTLDNGTTAPGQNSSEFGVTICMADMSGPFDYHLTQRILQICQEFEITHQRDIFKYYRSDSASAVEAGNDLRTALAAFGIDASHGWERIHWDSLKSLAELVSLYMQAPPLHGRDQYQSGPLPSYPAMEE
jgi:peptidase M42 family hydrolase